ncbi:putative ubiquitin-like-specific protease 1B [Phaseolus vulgaris]|uniref:putative ubiquitin-like-specific protease 1B n=1 Tax=Phaseolus vulgaris TaxID=3885 RepID=UPI0035CA62F1
MKTTSEKKEWDTKDYCSFAKDLIPFESLSYCDFVFIPTVHNDHWWVYAFNFLSRELHVLDPLGHRRGQRNKIDKAMAVQVDHVYKILDKFGGVNSPPIKVVKQKLPIQPNGYDCGVLVLKYIEVWNGMVEYEGKTMSEYNSEELQTFRKEMVCNWVLDARNAKRENVLREFNFRGTSE